MNARAYLSSTRGLWAMRLLSFLAFLVLITSLPVSPVGAMNRQGAVAAGVSAARPCLILVSALALVRTGQLVTFASGLGLAVMTTLNAIDLGAGRLGRTSLIYWLLLASLKWFDHARPPGNGRGVRHVH